MIPTRIARADYPDAVHGHPKSRKMVLGIFSLPISENPNTRMAYLTAAYRFADWCEVKGLTLEQVEPIMVAAYIEQLTTVYTPADRQAIPGGYPDAVRLARGRPGYTLQPGQLGTRPQARCKNRQDTGADSRGNPRAPR